MRGRLNDTRRWGGIVLMAAVLGCTVGETRPEEPGTPPATEIEERETPAPGGGGGATAEAEAAAADLLATARQAYDEARLEEALEQARRVATQYPSTRAADPAHWIAARAAFSLERYDEALELAEAYARTQPSGSEQAAEAQRLMELATDALEQPAPAMVGAVLPRTGSPVLVRYADWLLEGIELAVSEAERRQGRPIDLVVVDDEGGTRTREAVAELERRGAVAIIGPLLAQQLPEAAGARVNSQLVLLSPTAPETPGYLPQVYSVSAGHTRGAQELGRYASELGLPQAAILHLNTNEYRRKARAFAVEYEARGGVVQTTMPYDSGTTTFGPHLRSILQSVSPALVSAGDSAVGGGFGTLGSPVGGDTALAASGMQPFALFVAAPGQDVPQIAPQVSFYGLDSAGVQVLGGEAWAAASVRRVVPARDLEGVISASPFPADRQADVADPTFVDLYESTYRRSLGNPLPALGYDAAHLLLQALPSRRLTPGAVARRFELLAGIRGATGLFSVRGGALIRTPFLVMIENGMLVPAPAAWEYELPVPVPPKEEPTAGGAS